jgi:hypothetical protein
MPSYKILGIYSFAENIKAMHLDDPVILKKEEYNIKSKDAIGVYSIKDKKLGYLPVENHNEIKDFNLSYKISKLILNQDYPVLEISRYYPKINYLDNIEYPFEKKIKYEYKLVKISNALEKSIVSLEKYLYTKKLKVKRTAVIYVDENFINILIEISRGIQQFQTVTIKYFKENSEKYEELYENNLIDSFFYRDLLIYRLECYFESNYESILSYPEITNKFLLKYIPTIKVSTIHNSINLEIKSIDNIILVKLYLRYLLTNNDYYLLKYVDKIDKKLVNLLNNFINTYNLELGKFTYDHSLKIYDYIDFTNSSTVFIISSDFKTNYLYTAYLTSKKNIIIYNPFEGTILEINDIDLNLFI